MRAISLTVLFLGAALCGACWRSHTIAQPGTGGAGGVGAATGASAGTGGQAARAGGAGQAASGAGAEGRAGAGGQEFIYCGDGVINGEEQCEGLDLGGESCASLGQGSGTLYCDASTCRFDLSMCAPDPGQTVPSVYPDGTVYPVPQTPQECTELSLHLQRTYLSYSVLQGVVECSCYNCLDSYGPCLVDFDCLNVVACCSQAGYYDMSCISSAECSDVVSAIISDSVSSSLAMGISACFLNACQGAAPAF